jgi:hypothetical protein
MTADSATDAVSTRNWRPPYFGTALALLAVFSVGVALAADVSVVQTTATTASGAVTVAGTVWLAARERFRAVAVALAAVLLFPAGALTTTGTVLAVLENFTGTSPGGAVFVVAALSVAAFGAAALPSDAVAADSAAAGAKLAFGVGALTVGAAVPPVVGAVLANRSDLPTVSLPSVDPFGPLLAPQAGPTPPLGTFLILLGLAAVALARTLGALPIRELLDDGTTRENLALAGLDRVLFTLQFGWIGLGVGVMLLFLNLVGPAETAWGALPASLVSLLGDVTTASEPRALSVGIVLVAVVQLLLTRFLRSAYRTTLGAHAGKVGLVAGWLGLVWLGWTRAPLLTDTFRVIVVQSLPASGEDVFLMQWEGILSYYGVSTIGLAMVAVCVAVAAIVVVGLALGMALGVIPGAGVGYALASAGVFGAGAFGIAVGAGTSVSLAGIVVGILVWDVGTYGVELGREVGRVAPSRNAQVVHAAGTLLVSVTAAGTAVVATDIVARIPLAPDAPGPLALAAGLAAVVVFVLALRE